MKKKTTTPKSVPARTREVRENQMVSLAVDLAEKQLLEGTASSQVITHYLKLGTVREKKQMELLDKQGAYMDAKTESLHSAKKTEELYAEAIDAMRRYNGQQGSDENLL